MKIRSKRDAGETIDWDNGMVAVAVYRAMLSALRGKRSRSHEH